MSIRLFDFNVEAMLSNLDSLGATSFPVLTDGVRQVLLQAAMRCDYVKQPEKTPSGVCQDVYAVRKFPLGSPFHMFCNCWQNLLARRLEAFPGLFARPLKLAHLLLQRYDPGSFGITAHQDFAKSRNLVCNFNLSGRAKFYIYTDAARTRCHQLETRPGNVIIMRAPGYRNSDIRPVHFVTDVKGPRYSLGIRQE
jgi:hypothetical protein